MNTITINDKIYSAPDGCSINVINMNIINNKVYVNGKLFEDCNADNSKKIEITYNVPYRVNIVRIRLEIEMSV